jgi:uncharacterized membrane protein YuzA (DUF378 family)
VNKPEFDLAGKTVERVFYWIIGISGSLTIAAQIWQYGVRHWGW